MSLYWLGLESRSLAQVLDRPSPQGDFVTSLTAQLWAGTCEFFSLALTSEERLQRIECWFFMEYLVRSLLPPETWHDLVPGRWWNGPPWEPGEEFSMNVTALQYALTPVDLLTLLRGRI